MDKEFKYAVEVLPGLVWIASADGGLEFVSKTWSEYTGLSTEEALGLGWTRSVHPDDLPWMAEDWQAHIAAGQEGEHDARFRRHDGVYRWFTFRVRPLRDNSGKITNWVGINTDIEALKQADRVQAGEKRLLEMIAQGSPLPAALDALCRMVEEIVDGCLGNVLLIDADDRAFRHVAGPSLTPEFLRMIESTPADSDIGPWAYAASRNEQIIVADIATDSRWARSWRDLSTAHGLRASWTTPLVSKADKPLGVFTVYRREPGVPTRAQYDFVKQLSHIASIAIERGQAEEQLRRSELLMAQAQELSLSGSFSWRPGSSKILSSEHLYRISGLDPQVRLTFGKILSRVHPDDLSVFDELRERAYRAEHLEYEYRVQMPDGALRHMYMTAQPTRDREGNLEYIGAVRDITEQRKSEEAASKLRAELAHISRVNSLGALTASIAHEINQPLAGVMTNSGTCQRMLSADPPNIEGALETVRRTIRDGRRASDVVLRLRALFSKKVSINDSVDLSEAAREVVELVGSEIRRNRIALRLELAEVPAVRGDRVQLQQVILNLLLNAMEAMQEINDRPRQILLKTDQDQGGQVRLAVTDSGVGLEPQQIGKLFDAFYTTKSTGMGIGLSVSRSIIESHGGQLEAGSNGDCGATFTFSIPCRSDTAAADRSVGQA
jgi:PAS domain S-box-containing protein